MTATVSYTCDACGATIKWPVWTVTIAENHGDWRGTLGVELHDVLQFCGGCLTHDGVAECERRLRGAAQTEPQ